MSEVRGRFDAQRVLGLVVLLGILVAAVVTAAGANIAIVATAAGCAVFALAVTEYRRTRDILSPGVLASAFFIWMYSLKALYAQSSGHLSAGTLLDAYPLDVPWHGAMRTALLVALLGYGSFMSGYFFVTRDLERLPREPDIVNRRSVNWNAFAVQIAVALIVACLAYGILVTRAGGLGSYISGLANRSSTLRGVQFLTMSTQPGFQLCLIGIALWLRKNKSVGGALRVLLVLAIVVSFGGAVLSGGRAAILIGVALPLIALVHYVGRRVSVATAVVAVAVGLVVFVSFGAVFRDAVFAGPGGAGRIAGVKTKLRSIGDSALGGVEAVPLDALTIVVRASNEGELEFQYGRTYLKVLAWPVPRALWAGKPNGGGNAWFTSRYVPRFYGPNHVESSLSLFGEAFANFWWPGVALVGGLVGAIAGAAYRWARRTRDPVVYAIYSIYLGYLITGFRGDAYHNISSILFVTVIWWLITVSTMHTRETATT